MRLQVAAQSGKGGDSLDAAIGRVEKEVAAAQKKVNGGSK